MTEKKYTETEKLRMLLGHWLQHNESHGAEYTKWAETARDAGHRAAAEAIAEAVAYLGKADKALQQALTSLGGPGNERLPHHHHDHHHD